MADNVNIIVQDTINDIVVNAAVVVETIDINVQSNVEEVQIIANPNNYVVNINQGGGGGSQTLEETLEFGNNTGGTNILINDADAILLENNASLKKGTFDFGQDGGISRFCSVDYEDMWQGGIRHVFDNNGFIRNSTNCFNAVPNFSFDVTLRFKVGSIWTLDDGTNYICTDNTEGAAVWELYNVIPTATSDLTNDGEDGVNPFITAADLPDLTGFVPYTGATANVDLGEYELKAGQFTLDTSPTGTAAVATTRWNDTIGTTETTLKGGSVVLKNGIDLVARVVNKVTPNATLTKAAYQAVRISGAQGQRLAVAYAQANNDNNSADTIGIVCETIATNQEGFILTVGQLEEINTTGSLQGETWTDGDVLYLSPTTAGRLTNIKPTGATGHIVVMGYVEYAHAIHGKIYVKIMNGWELDELHNVFINSPANNEGLFYDSSDSLWKNKTIASALGYTPFQLPALTSGSVLFSNGTTIAQKNAQLFWDNTNNRLGIGTATPAYKLTVAGTIDAGTNLIGNGIWNQGIQPLGGTGEFRFVNSTGNGFFFTWVQNNGLERMRLSSNNNLLVGTATDAGFRLDVNGTARISGNTTIVAATPVLNINVTANTQTSALYFNAPDGTPRAGIMANIATGEIRYLATATGYFPTFYSNNVERMRIPTTGNVLINTTTDIASSQLTIASTTKGFLPPRMTTTQKNAIATPASGLVVYDTTLNKLCLYTTTWETITSI
jgi:nitrogen fixation protein